MCATGYTVSTSSSIYADVGSGPIFLYRTDCNGLESNVKLCNSLEYPSRYRGSQCNHYDDVTLQCRGMWTQMLQHSARSNRKKVNSMALSLHRYS